MGNLGIDLSSSDGNYRLHLWLRGQFRYSYPFDDAPTTSAGFETNDVSSIDVRRARLKVGGHAYRPWVDYYVEYDFVNSRLLDFRMTLTRIPWLQLRVGQWKVNYNRERADSSGRQQFVERSIVNREFTVDRQPGAMVAGHVLPGSVFDSWYMFGVFNGNGAGSPNDDGAMMWFARYQWQFFGRDLPYAQTDVEYHDKPAASLSFATLRNRSRFTRFSGSGGGQLDGFEDGVAGQYELTQFLEETAFKLKGLSVQHEFHWKTVDDTVNHTTTALRGSYTQAGYLPWARSESSLAPMELAYRFAWVDPDTSAERDARREHSLGVNWFFSGHDNKITFDFSWLTMEQLAATTLSDSRFRLQWDISF